MTINNLKDLVEINSHSLNPSGLKKAAKLLETLFAPLNAKKTVKKGVIFYEKRKNAPIQIVLGGHYDTVYPKNSPFQKLSSPTKEILKGPGVADMKGGLIILLEALKGFEKTAHKETVGWRLFLNPDEEIGSPTSAPLIEAFSKGAQAAFLFEPALPDGSLVSARKGSLNVVIRSYGKSAHAGRDLQKGKNALIPLALLIRDLDGIKGLNVAAIEGGQAFNVVPERGLLKLNFRSEDLNDFKTFKARLKKLVKAYKLELEIISYRPPKPFDKKTKKLVEALGYPVKVKPSGGVCDGNLISALGIPTLDTLGAIGNGLHTEEESIETSSLKDRSELFLNFLIRLSKEEATLC